MLWRQSGGIVEIILLQTSCRLPTITFIIEIPGAAARPERRDNAEIKVGDEEEEKRRDPSFPLCETSAFRAGGGGEFASEPALPQ